MSASAHKLWSDLVAAALVGTERKPTLAGVNGNAPALGAVLASVNSADAEKALLDTATAVAAYSHAGAEAPASANPLPAPAAAEDLPYSDEATTKILARLLEGKDAGLISEWLLLAQEHRRIVRPEYLPQLLEAARQNMELHVRLPATIGKRGLWLVAQNPDWDFVEETVDLANQDDAKLLARFETLTGTARLNFLLPVRRANPALGRQMIEGTWKQEKADARKTMMSRLLVNLSSDDEPFLEAALDDRSQDVRERAANHLSRLRDSRFVARMIERVTPLISYTPAKRGGLLGAITGAKSEIKLTLPAENTREMQRDGITDPSRGYDMGKKAWWLTQMIGAIPPDYWTTRFAATPRELVQAALRNEWKAVFLRGWAEAASNYDSAEWAETLLDREVEGQFQASNAGRLFNIMPAERWERYVLDRLRTDARPFDANKQALVALTRRYMPWSVELSREVLRNLRQMAKSRDQNAYMLSNSLDIFARRMAPEVAGEAEGGWPTESSNWGYWSYTIAAFLSVLGQRAEMYKEWNKV